MRLLNFLGRALKESFSGVVVLFPYTMAGMQHACLFICDLQISHCRAAEEAAGIYDISNSLETGMRGRPWLCHRVWMMHGKGQENVKVVQQCFVQHLAG